MYRINIHRTLYVRDYEVKFEFQKSTTSFVRLLKDMVIIVSTELTQFYVPLNNSDKITIFI